MKLILKDCTEISNVTCSEKMIEIKVTDYSEIASIYTSVTNKNLNGAQWKTSTDEIIGTYGSVEISSSSMNNNVIRFNLIDSRSAEEQQMKQRIEELELELEKERETFTESIQELTASVNESIDTLMTEILPSLEDMIYSSLEDNNVDNTGKDVEESEPIENTNNVGENNVVAESEEG